MSKCHAGKQIVKKRAAANSGALSVPLVLQVPHPDI